MGIRNRLGIRRSGTEIGWRLEMGWAKEECVLGVMEIIIVWRLEMGWSLREHGD